MKKSIIPSEQIAGIIYIVRGQRVMLDRDLAALYGVETRALAQAVKRNIKKFPEDFMFHLSWEEAKILRSQFVILKENQRAEHGRHTKYRPYVFTEHGAVMAANILRSERATLVSIEVVRAFIRFRQVLTSQKELAKEVAELKSFVLKHSHKTDQEFRRVWATIDKLSAPPPYTQARIGFDLGQGQ